MTNYREILRLTSLGLNNTQAAEGAGCSRTTVIQVKHLATENGLECPILESMSDKELAERLFPSAVGKPAYHMPDYDYVYRQMQRSSVTLNLLWLEYCDNCTPS